MWEALYVVMRHEDVGGFCPVAVRNTERTAQQRADELAALAADGINDDKDEYQLSRSDCLAVARREGRIVGVVWDDGIVPISPLVWFTVTAVEDCNEPEYHA